jgi:hypothetical protein
MDQWEGPGALWFGAASSLNDAGPVDGLVGDVPNARNALLTSQIIDALADNESFESSGDSIMGTNISDAGAASLAGAIAINLPEISEYMVQSGFDEQNPPYAGWLGNVSGLAELRRYHDLADWQPIWVQTA